LLRFVIEIALKIFVLGFVNVKVKQSNPITGLDRARGFQEVEVPRFQYIRHMKAFSPTHRPPLPLRKYLWNSILGRV
jgi:hypothetical protein